MSITTKESTPMSRDLKKKYAYDQQYHKDKTTVVHVRLNIEKDADILAYLSAIPNKQGHIKHLLRQRMEQSGFSVADVMKEETEDEESIP